MEVTFLPQWLAGECPVNASPAMLPPPAHDSGLERFATLFLCGSLIRLLLAGFDRRFRCPLFTPVIPEIPKSVMSFFMSLSSSAPSPLDGYRGCNPILHSEFPVFSRCA